MAKQPDTQEAQPQVAPDKAPAPVRTTKQPDSPALTQTAQGWASALGVRPSVAAGAEHLLGVDGDTPITEVEFRRAVDDYTNRPMGGHQ